MKSRSLMFHFCAVLLALCTCAVLSAEDETKTETDDLSPISSTLTPKIVIVHSITEATPHFEEVDERTVVFIDVDATLTIPSDPHLQPHIIRHHQSVYNEFVTGLSPDQSYYFNHLWCIESPSQLLDDEFPGIISALQARRAKVLAYTAAKTGGVGPFIDSFPEWRYQELKRLGIDFSKDFPGEVLFKDFSDFAGNCPGMHKGVVYSGQKLKKGDVVDPVIDALALECDPLKVIVIDDRLDHIESIKDALRKRFSSLQFIGIHYRRLDRLSIVEIEIDIFRQKFSELVVKTKSIC